MSMDGIIELSTHNSLRTGKALGLMASPADALMAPSPSRDFRDQNAHSGTRLA